MGLGDIYYILFRRKWVILSVSLLGFIAAGVTYAVWRPKYQSVAELYIGYVADAPTPDMTTGPDIRPVAIDRGATILNTELQIVQSLDLARQVAETIGPAKILGDPSYGTNTTDVDMAAIEIQRDLVTEVPKNTQIIRLAFSHKDSSVVKPVLELLVTNYISKHSSIHQRTEEFNPILRDQATIRKNRLGDLARQLATAKREGGIVDLAEEMKAFTAQESAIQQENYLALAELDGALKSAELLRTLNPPVRVQGAPTNASAEAPTNASAPAVLPPTHAQQDAYNKARQDLADLQARGAKLESMYTSANPQVKTNLLEIDAAEAKKEALEKETPGLVALAAAAETRMPSAPGASSVPAALDPTVAYNAELAKIADLSGRIERQTNELAVIKGKGTNLVGWEVIIHDLERRMAMDEQELMQIERTTDKADMDAVLGPNGVSNISESEAPTPPARETKLFYKVIAGIAGGGVVLGLGLACLLELVLDRSFKRPQEVTSRLGLPFFLSVPYQNGNGKLRLSKQGKEVKLLPAGTVSPNGGGAEGARQSAALPGGGVPGGAVALAHNGPMAPPEDKLGLRPFHETLRDRLIAYFEMLNLTHKPKLVALTSCHDGAGVSTMASGLASLLSETGDGNVLLVNMTSEEGEAHRFYKGRLNLGLDDLFEKEEKPNRENALVQENLYVVRESSNRDKLPAILPKRFGHLVSKMKASDYDYIIFDMPPVTQISVTPRLARFMDMVLLVVESEKTDRDVAQRAASLLSESRANVGVVMNKSRSYVPRMLHQEL